MTETAGPGAGSEPSGWVKSWRWPAVPGPAETPSPLPRGPRPRGRRLVAAPALSNRQPAPPGRNAMTMADICLTAAAEAAFSDLQATAPDQADTVSEALNNIPAANGRRIDLPGAPAAE